MIAARVTRAEHAALAGEGGGGWRVAVRTAAAGDGPDASLDRAGPGHRARAHPAGCPHRQQPEPARALGEHTCLGGRGPRGCRPAGGGRAVPARPGPAPTERTPMHIRFLGCGTGSARAAADYLVGERDAAGRVRPGIEVLRGNPDLVAAVADSLDFEHKLPVARDHVGAGSTAGRPRRRSDGRPRRVREDGVGQGWRRTATPGRRPCTGSTATGSTCTSSPRAATWRRAAA